MNAGCGAFSFSSSLSVCEVYASETCSPAHNETYDIYMYGGQPRPPRKLMPCLKIEQSVFISHTQNMLIMSLIELIAIFNTIWYKVY